MIRLTRLNHAVFYRNPDLIQEMEATPDTVITLTTGTRLRVQEGPQVVIDLVIEYKRRVQDPRHWLDEPAPESGMESILDRIGQEK
jgi:flagellar protein FlbD